MINTLIIGSLIFFVLIFILSMFIDLLKDIDEEDPFE